MRHGSLRGRFLLAALAVFAPLLAGGAVWLLLIANSGSEYRGVAREAVEEADHSVVLLQHLNEAEKSGLAYLRSGAESELGAFRRTATQIDRELADADAYDEQVELVPFQAIRQPWGRAKRYVTGGGDHAAVQDTFEAEMHSAVDGVSRLMVGMQHEISAELTTTDRDARLNWLLGLSSLAVALLIAALLASRLSRSLVRPLKQLVRATRALATGQLDYRVQFRSTRELNELGDAFNATAAALEQQRAELERHAFTDLLTGLANRALFEDRARHALDRVAGGPERVAVLVLDLDTFKLVNEGLGHSCGDALLRQAAERMGGLLRPSDTLARLGSDEFAVLLESVRGLDDALGAAERLRQAFGAPFALKSSDVLMTVSVGIAMSTEETRDATELLRRADLATDRVKSRGRNGVEFFDPAMDDQAGDRLELVNSLRGAADRGELIVHYQPVVHLETGEVRAAEALLRWQRPGRGLVSPLDFIPLAEQTGVIAQIGEWVLCQACAEAQRWEQLGLSTVPVTVNVSARQLLDPRFERIVAGALGASGLDPCRLILEVTESSVMQNADVTIAKLVRISSTGVRIALDDFGEGYSSLGQLRSLPIDILKIARTFVGELTDNAKDPALVRGIIELARSLGLRLVAEGIETRAQAEILRSFDCELGQGFLFARPMEAKALRARLGERPVAPVGG